MAQKARSKQHGLQIKAGSVGRRKGHEFESELAERLNKLDINAISYSQSSGHLFTGCPSALLLQYILERENLRDIKQVAAVATGKLATSESDEAELIVNGITVTKSKSDIVITITDATSQNFYFGISIKQCNKPNPTNAQLFFTTAEGFSSLLVKNGINVSENAKKALKQFCGDKGYRPLDTNLDPDRKTDPRRYFWEEINDEGRREWEALFTERQDEITRLLLQKAYSEDSFSPDYILHKTKSVESGSQPEVAIYAIEELVDLSKKYKAFETKEYSVNKGSYKDPKGTKHQAPRFGIIQFQRGGQKQHPTQLQFNLESGYFNKLTD